MRQLATLLWLKWTLFRNSLRSSKAVVNRVATILAMLFALALALLLALGLGLVAYALTTSGMQNFHPRARRGEQLVPSAEFIFFSILSFLYLLWATLPLSIGSSRQFDPGNLLLYPINLRKLFAVDFASEVASLQSVFAIPAIIAIGIGAGLAQGKVAAGILIALAAVVFGLALSKWISTSVGSLLRKKRARGETLLALIGVIAGLGGALFGQIAPVVFRHADWVASLRWTPPGAIAYGLTYGLRTGNALAFSMALLAVTVYAVGLIGITYWLARRAVLGGGGGRRRARVSRPAERVTASYTGWELPLMSPALSAIVEKELRYLLRNAQVRMMTLMPLILLVVRIMNKRRFAQIGSAGGPFASQFFKYGEGLMATGGMLYVFLVLSGLFCNQFAFEGSGMRTLILSPVDRKTILLGKNIAFSLLALVFSAGLLLVNELVFRDITAGALLFVVLSFLIFVTLMSLMGNWFSLRFPKRMKFGKRLNISGAAGLLLLPMIVVLGVPPFAATVAGFVTQSLLVEYATLGLLAALLLGLYVLIIGAQGESLQRREVELLAAVNDPGND
jgi:hypothetical protein